MNVNLKSLVNRLQFHIDRDGDYNEILLIFDTNRILDQYKKSIRKLIDKDILPKNYLDDKVLASISDLTDTNFLTGRRFTQYYFMTDEWEDYERDN